jgi:hypothetical protein
MYSDKIYDRIVSELDRKTGMLIDTRAIDNDYLDKHDIKLKRIFY